LRPGYAPAASGLATIHFNRGEYDKAAQFGRLAVRSSPGTADYLLRLGDTYFKMNRKSDAKAQWERAARLGSDVAKKRLAKL
jgi:tetratricopeptide (TPR) repeat protein